MNIINYQNVSFKFDPDAEDKFVQDRPHYQFNLLEKAGHFLISSHELVSFYRGKAKHTISKTIWIALDFFAGILSQCGQWIKQYGERWNTNLTLRNQIIQLKQNYDQESEQVQLKSQEFLTKSHEIIDETHDLNEEINHFIKSRNPAQQKKLETIFLNCKNILAKASQYEKLNLTYQETIEVVKNTHIAQDKVHPLILSLLADDAGLKKKYEALYIKTKENRINELEMLEINKSFEKIELRIGSRINFLISQMT